jgi:hypothetical protein
MELNKCTHECFYENIYSSLPMILKNSMGPMKSRCDVRNGTIQQWVCPIPFEFGIININAKM